MDESRRIALLEATLVTTGSPAVAIEEPPYEIVADYREFEIRRYPAIVAAVTRVDGDFDTAGNRGFRSLAGYIFGGNGEDERIAMTAPVAQSATRDGEPGAWQVVFQLPPERTIRNLPRPDGEGVEVLRIEGKTVAALPFSGRWSEARFHDREAILRAWMAEHSIPPDGPSTWARYDPPWTLWFLRRNEIFVEIPSATVPGCALPEQAESAA